MTPGLPPAETTAGPASPAPPPRPAWRIRLLLGGAFALSSLLSMSLDVDGPPVLPFADLPVERAASAFYLSDPSNPRIAYVRPPGDPAGLLEIFDGVSVAEDAGGAAEARSPAEMAARYGIPRTPRDVVCDPDGTTTVGWIPAATNTTKSDRESYGRIPRLLFQSWKTNELNPRLCRHVLRWARTNPEVDYFLFDDRAADRFVAVEYGLDVYSSYACVSVGAAKCDVWRLLVVYLYGGIYFDLDAAPVVPFREWRWGEETDVVTGRSCRARKKYPLGCAHQWGLM